MACHTLSHQKQKRLAFLDSTLPTNLMDMQSGGDTMLRAAIGTLCTVHRLHDLGRGHSGHPILTKMRFDRTWRPSHQRQLVCQVGKRLGSGLPTFVLCFCKTALPKYGPGFKALPASFRRKRGAEAQRIGCLFGRWC